MNNIHTIFDFKPQKLPETEKELNDILDKTLAELTIILDQNNDLCESTQQIFSESQKANQQMRCSNKKLQNTVKVVSQINKRTAQLVNLLKGVACVALSVGCYYFTKNQKM